MKRLALAGLGVVVLAAAGSAPAAPAHRCAVPKSKTLFENSKVRVFTRTYGAEHSVRTQLCRKSDGRHSGLAQDAPSTKERVSLIGMRGGWLSYSVTGSRGNACRFYVPQRKRHCALGTGVRGIGVTAHGTLAWLADSSGGSGGEPTCCSVYRMDAGSKDPTTLDSGADIDPTSFATAPHRAYWLKGGEPQSAPLP